MCGFFFGFPDPRKIGEWNRLCENRLKNPFQKVFEVQLKTSFVLVLVWSSFPLFGGAEEWFLCSLFFSLFRHRNFQSGLCTHCFTCEEEEVSLVVTKTILNHFKFIKLKAQLKFSIEKFKYNDTKRDNDVYFYMENYHSILFSQSLLTSPWWQT